MLRSRIWNDICISSFFILTCSRMVQALVLQPKHEPLISKSTRSDSIDKLSTRNASGSFRPDCSFAGPSWNPLQDCFPGFGAVDVASKVEESLGQNLLCKLKKDLALPVWSTWSEASTAFHEVDSTVHDKSASEDRLDHSVNHSKAVVSARMHKKKIHGGDRDGDGVESAMQKYNMNDFFNQNYSGSHGRLFHTCSVVSNSGVLRHYYHGSAIDSVDMVLRFNDAPLQEWSQFVGTRDNMRIVNNQFPERVLRNAMPSYAFEESTLFGLLTFKDSETFVPPGLNRLRSKYPTTAIRVLPYNSMKSFEQTLRSIYHADWFQVEGVSFKPTTGAMGMLSALVACDEIRAFGMAATPAAASSAYHYYKEDEPARAELKADENSWHKSFRAEKDLWRRVARNPASQIDSTDIAVIPGFSQVHCP
mmetsp:Transcript_12547/g.20683  ORF Transcript_12547/g.20683 Transcript_12547/m.20683 type:complete len:420 (-) Transcript_12547:10-1269(-)